MSKSLLTERGPAWSLIAFLLTLSSCLGQDTITPTPGPTRSPSLAPVVTPPPPCITSADQLVYNNATGFLDSTETIKHCISRVTDPMLLPIFYNAKFNGVQRVNASIQLNNLHYVDALTSSVTLDFYLRITWKDDRLAMPIFWKTVDPRVRSTGVELTRVLDNTQIWFPDVRFHDVSEYAVQSFTFRLNSSNILFWSQHIVATYIQPTLDLREYPSDSQTIHIRFGSYAYDNRTFTMGYWGNALSFNTNFDKSMTFLQNPSWTFVNDSSFEYQSLYTSSSNFVNCIFHIPIERKSDGIVIRLVLPITLLLLLSGLTFWAPYENRVDSTVTLLLSVSALYIVILANIPLVGYLTTVDRFVFIMFLFLVMNVGIHQTYATMLSKADMYPLRIVVMRVIEFCGRVFIIPLITVVYLNQIKVADAVMVQMYAIIMVFAGAVAVREWKGFRKALSTSLYELKVKLDEKVEKSAKSLSFLEVIVLNQILFNKRSYDRMSIRKYLKEHANRKTDEEIVREQEEVYKAHIGVQGLVYQPVHRGLAGSNQLTVLPPSYEHTSLDLSSSTAHSSTNGLELKEIPKMGSNPMHGRTDRGGTTERKPSQVLRQSNAADSDDEYDEDKNDGHNI